MDGMPTAIANATGALGVKGKSIPSSPYFTIYDSKTVSAATFPASTTLDSFDCTVASGVAAIASTINPCGDVLLGGNGFISFRLQPLDVAIRYAAMAHVMFPRQVNAACIVTKN